uniref:Putative ficolin/ixoderin n=1 Tax=Ixodes ricinus TaxID=34613 RepID=A0A0K8RND4_IXORI
MKNIESYPETFPDFSKSTLISTKLFLEEDFSRFLFGSDFESLSIRAIRLHVTYHFYWIVKRINVMFLFLFCAAFLHLHLGTAYRSISRFIRIAGVK